MYGALPWEIASTPNFLDYALDTIHIPSTWMVKIER